MNGLEYRSLLSLPRKPPDDVIAGVESQVWIKPPATVRPMLRYAPEFIDDPDGVRIFDLIEAAVYRLPPVWLASVPNATIVGYRTVISNGIFFNDDHRDEIELQTRFLERLASADAFLNEETGLRRGEDGLWTCDRDGKETRELDHAVAVLCSTEPVNYGSLLFRVVPKILILRELGLDRLPVLVWAKHPSFGRMLSLVGVEPQNIIQHEVEKYTVVKRAVVPSLRNPDAFLDRESSALYQGLSDRHSSGTARRRIYISRMHHGQHSGYATRVMTNEQDLASALTKLGFDIIEPERLSVEQQIDSFASAEIIVGPSGSGLFNVAFARPGTKLIDIESEPNWIYAHAGLFASCQLRYGLFMGKCDPADTRPVHRSWSVNVEALVDRVRDFLHA